MTVPVDPVAMTGVAGRVGTTSGAVAAVLTGRAVAAAGTTGTEAASVAGATTTVGRPARDDRRDDRRQDREPLKRLPIDEEVTGAELDKDVRQELMSLPKTLAEDVAKNLVMVARLLDEDPEAAYGVREDRVAAGVPCAVGA